MYWRIWQKLPGRRWRGWWGVFLSRQSAQHYLDRATVKSARQFQILPYQSRPSADVITTSISSVIYVGDDYILDGPELDS